MLCNFIWTLSMKKQFSSVYTYFQLRKMLQPQQFFLAAHYLSLSMSVLVSRFTAQQKLSGYSRTGFLFTTCQWAWVCWSAGPLCSGHHRTCLGTADQAYYVLPVSKPECAGQQVHCVAVITEPVWVQQNKLTTYYLSVSLSVLVSWSTV